MQLAHEKVWYSGVLRVYSMFTKLKSIILLYTFNNKGFKKGGYATCIALLFIFVYCKALHCEGSISAQSCRDEAQPKQCSSFFLTTREPKMTLITC